MPYTEGSIAIGREILEAAQLQHYEVVRINNQSTGASWETYVIASDDAGVCEARGGAAHHIQEGHLLVVLSYSWEIFFGNRISVPRIVYFDNREADNPNIITSVQYEFNGIDAG